MVKNKLNIYLYSIRYFKTNIEYYIIVNIHLQDPCKRRFQNLEVFPEKVMKETFNLIKDSHFISLLDN